MTNVEIIEVEGTAGELQTHVIIDNGDSSFTSMTKAHWDKLEATKEQSGTL